MKDYLIATFKFNDWANKQVIAKVKELPEQGEAVRLISHLINCQNRWMARAIGDPKQAQMSWNEPVYNYDELLPKWNECLGVWVNYLQDHSEDEIHTEVRFLGTDGTTTFGVLPKDMALQLNYHSIHHRAQICSMIRKQGLKPPYVEYIDTAYKKY